MYFICCVSLWACYQCTIKTFLKHICFKEWNVSNNLSRTIGVFLLETPLNPSYPNRFNERGEKNKRSTNIIYHLYNGMYMNIIFYASIILLSLIYFCAWGQEPTPFPSQPQQEEMGLFWRKNSLYSVFYILLTWDTLYYIYPVYLCFLWGGCPQAHMVLITVKTYYVIYFTILYLYSFQQYCTIKKLKL